jgi:predicted PurR-regulated permease PerM
VSLPSWLSTPAQRYRFVLVAALAYLVIRILVAAWAALVPFFLGLLLAYLLLPVVNVMDRNAPRLLRRRGLSRPLAIIIVYVVGIALTAGVLSYFIPAVSSQADVLVSVLPTYVERVQGLLMYDVGQILEGIPPEIQEAVNTNLQRALGTVWDGLQKGLQVTVRTVSQTVSFIIGMAIVPFWLFYVLNDEARGRRAFFNAIPEVARDDVRCIFGILDGLLSSYLRGQLILCVLVGVMATISLVILGVDLALLLGTFAGIFELIPILGPYLGAVPAVLIALLKQPILAVWVALSFFAIQQIENLFLVPRIAGNAVRFHPAVVMVIVVVGAEVAGVWGMLLGVPLAAMVRDVSRYLYLRTTDRGATPEMAMDSLRASTGLIERPARAAAEE